MVRQVNNVFIFLAVEEEVRCHLPSLQSVGSHKDDLYKSIASSEDVCFIGL